jgi:hypothetical protein
MLSTVDVEDTADLAYSSVWLREHFSLLQCSGIRCATKLWIRGCAQNANERVAMTSTKAVSTSRTTFPFAPHVDNLVETKRLAARSNVRLLSVAVGQPSPYVNIVM